VKKNSENIRNSFNNLNQDVINMILDSFSENDLNIDSLVNQINDKLFSLKTLDNNFKLFNNKFFLKIIKENNQCLHPELTFYNIDSACKVDDLSQIIKTISIYINFIYKFWNLENKVSKSFCAESFKTNYKVFEDIMNDFFRELEKILFFMKQFIVYKKSSIDLTFKDLQKKFISISENFRIERFYELKIFNSKFLIYKQDDQMYFIEDKDQEKVFLKNSDDFTIILLNIIESNFEEDINNKFKNLNTLYKEKIIEICKLKLISIIQDFLDKIKATEKLGGQITNKNLKFLNTDQVINNNKKI
jgi:hypothetical protein